jgi:16S rRNA (cytidine1402-2'-O)-methyltransferase
MTKSESAGTAAGTLYVVGTPIGNLADLSARSAEVLAQVDLIAAEDTRHTGRLLSRIGVEKPLISHHEHNESESAPALIDRLKSGASVALVADAGMPLISDPGWRLVSLAANEGIPVVSVPGPSAVTAALSISGLPTDRFCFEGFLPRTGSRRAERLSELAGEPRTMVFFESVHRLGAMLADLADAFGGDRPAAVLRELTKLHESVYRDRLDVLAAKVGDLIPARGEFVIVVGGRKSAALPADDEVSRIYELLVREIPPDRAVKLTVAITGRSRNEVYRLTRR